MTEHTTISKVSRLEIIQTGARRRWTTELKQRIVAESYGVPRNVSATARQHGMSSSQLFTWRRLARQGRLIMANDAMAFVPAIVGPGQPIPESLGDHAPQSLVPQAAGGGAVVGRMEIILSGARRVIVGSDVDAAALAQVVGVLEAR
jgi:transposase